MMARPDAAGVMAEHPGEPAGYSVVARALNEAFDWPDGREISRQQVEAWHVRRTLNQMGQPPPSPSVILRGVPRTAPRALFDVAQWVQWARAGVPESRDAPGAKARGWHGTGWTVPAEKS